MDSTKYVINPESGRNILVRGKKYWLLVKKGVLQGDLPNLVYDPKKELDPNVVHNMDKKELYDHLYEKKEELKHTIPNDKVLAIAKNKLITKKPTMKMQEVSERTANSALDIIDSIQNNEIEIPSNMSRIEARDYLQRLIFEKMLSNKKKFVNTKIEKTGKPIRKVPKYYISKDTETESTDVDFESSSETTETETDY